LKWIFSADSGADFIWLKPTSLLRFIEWARMIRTTDPARDSLRAIATFTQLLIIDNVSVIEYVGRKSYHWWRHSRNNWSQPK
jgi:hypothetical protein